MITTKIVKLRINNKTISHYKKLGYDVECNKTYDIKVVDLTTGSHVEISAKCDICEIEKKVWYKEYNRNIKKYNIFCCCNKCATIKSKKSSIEKYGVDHFSKTTEFIEKVKKTSINKFGTEYYTQTNEYKDIMIEYNKNCDYTESTNQKKKTCLLKYGVDDYHKSEYYKSNKNNIIEKYKNTITKKLLNKYSNLISTDNLNYIFLCHNNHEFQISRELLKNRNKLCTEICTICNPIGSSKSGYEIQLAEFISNNISENILKNNRTTLNNKYELDIYIPESKLAFEFNGLYWHSEVNKENNYHLNKTEACEEQGIQLIHIWEDDWLYKQDIIKSMILNKLNKTPNKIFARKTKIMEITDNKLVREFLNKNHIQGFVGSKIKLGLFYENELVSLMTFGNRRVIMGKKSTNQDEYELLRFCNKLNTNIIGGASKLFKYFIKNYNSSEITTYADRSISQGKLYETLGFEFVCKTQPNYYYIVDGIRYYRFNFRKDILVKQGFDSNKTEHQIMIDRKIYRLYDSGNLKYKKSRN
jgi:very-short-patch-repair endonuclease